MITSIAIENLRGIADGKLEGLAPLTILTGPNASGKSTVLDALLAGASPDIENAVGEAVARHGLRSGGARWMIRGSKKTCQVHLEDSSGVRWARSFQWFPYCTGSLQEQLWKKGAQKPYSSVSVMESSDGSVESSAVIGFGSDDQSVGDWSGRRTSSSVEAIELIDPGIPQPLHRDYSQVVKAGREEVVEQAMRGVLPEFEEFVLLVGDGDIPELHIRSGDTPVPLPFSGDGIQAFAQVVVQAAMVSGGILLIEEPEVYLHPRGIWRVAEFLLELARFGIQIVLTTHSLELIDALIGQAKSDDVEKMALFNLKLDKGHLKTSRRAGEDLAFARQEMETDLR